MMVDMMELQRVSTEGLSHGQLRKQDKVHDKVS